MSSESYLSASCTSSRRSSITSVTSDLFDKRAPAFDAIRHGLEDVKRSIRHLNRQIDSYEQKRHQLTESFEILKQANKDYQTKVRDLLEIFTTPASTVVFPSYSSKIGDRIGTQRYESNRSSRSSSRSFNAEVVEDDYYDDSSYDDYPNERSFTKSIDNIEIESSDA